LIDYFFTKGRQEMLKTNSILTEKILMVVQPAYTLHTELNRPAQNRRQQSRALIAHGTRWSRTPLPKLKHNSDSEIKRN